MNLDDIQKAEMKALGDVISNTFPGIGFVVLLVQKNDGGTATKCFYNLDSFKMAKIMRAQAEVMLGPIAAMIQPEVRDEDKLLPGQFCIESAVKLFLTNKEGEKTSTHNETRVMVDIKGEGADRSTYQNEDGSFTAYGIKSSTIALIAGLNSNIHNAHQRGLWDSAEHLRYIIDELERGFVMITETGTGIYGRRKG